MQKCLLLALLMLFLGTYASTDPSPKDGQTVIVFAVDATYPPMEFKNEDNELVGFTIDVVQEIASAAGFHAELVDTPWDNIFSGLLKNKYDAIASTVSITEERLTRMEFSTPYVAVGPVLLVPGDSSATHLGELTGKKLGLVPGFMEVLISSRYPGVLFQRYDTSKAGASDLLNGSLDGLVTHLVDAALLSIQDPEYRGRVKIVGEALDEDRVGIAVAQGNQEVLALINQGLAIIIANGRLESIKTKWGFGERSPSHLAP